MESTVPRMSLLVKGRDFVLNLAGGAGRTIQLFYTHAGFTEFIYQQTYIIVALYIVQHKVKRRHTVKLENFTYD